jgi:hypothetical protein
MQETYNSVKSQGMFALDASRLYAYVAITMHESMVHGIQNGKSLAGQLHGLSELPLPDKNKIYDWGIVLCQATPQVLKSTLPGIKPEIVQRINNLSTEQEKSMEATNDISSEVMKNSKEYAIELSDAIIAWSKDR